MLFRSLKHNHPVNDSFIIFSKITDEEMEAQIQKLENKKLSNVVEEKKDEKDSGGKTILPFKEATSFEDFSKMDIRIGTILEAERVPKTEKLLKLLIDTGIDKRTVVSGIAEFYKPEDIIGKQVSILVNLAPRKIKGIESNGMILMAENSNGELAFVSPSKEINNGGTVK